MKREWFALGEIADMALPGLPASKRALQVMADRERWTRAEWRNSHWRPRAGRGGGVEYHHAVLPPAAQVKIVMQHARIDPAEERAASKAQLTREELWAWFEQQPDKKKAAARAKLDALRAVEALVIGGVVRTVAMQEIAARSDVALSGLYRWAKAVHGIEAHDWLPYLAPRHAGRTATAECPDEAWEIIKADYLRPEQPNFAACYRRLGMIAAERGWTLPSEETLLRRMDALPEALRTLMRKGVDALKRLHPAQQRDRGVFHALEAVNADGHKWDVFVRWPDGTVGRPVMVAFQDLFSGLVLSWRVDQTENKECVRLAFGDMVERLGIPDHFWLDNGRNFASKWLTGGTPNRYRFKVRDDEPSGVMTTLGVQIHWTTPYSGQSKPIERCFRDMAQDLAKHPRFAGAWTGNTPMAKPENYASTAVPLDVFLRTIGEGIAEHNARIGRKTAVCGGRLSFEQAFAASYAAAPIRKATPEQRRLWLMAAESVAVRQQDGTVHLLGNRYWSDFLLGFRGQRVTVRFDPQSLHDDLHVYRNDGGYLGAAPCIEAAGFNDVERARADGAKRRAWMRATRELAAVERSLTIDDVAALLPASDEPEAPPQTKVVRPLFVGSPATKLQVEEDEVPETIRLFNRAVAAQRTGLRLIEGDAGGDD